MQVQGRTLQTTRTLFSCPTLLAPKKSYIFGFSQIVSSSCIPNSLSAETALCTGGDTSATQRHLSLISSPLSSARVTSVSGSNPALTASYTHRIPIHPAHLTIITFPQAENNDAKMVLTNLKQAPQPQFLTHSRPGGLKFQHSRVSGSGATVALGF